jgi:hypothetical protein
MRMRPYNKRQRGECHTSLLMELTIIMIAANLVAGTRPRLPTVHRDFTAACLASNAIAVPNTSSFSAIDPLERAREYPAAVHLTNL